ncbi:MAG: hypothetical protein ABIP58_08175 [Dehalococcoidia bacterium]
MLSNDYHGAGVVRPLPVCLCNQVVIHNTCPGQLVCRHPHTLGKSLLVGTPDLYVPFAELNELRLELGVVFGPG